MQFRQPYYVSQHAVRRFRERIADLPTRAIRTIIMAALQGYQEAIITGYNKTTPSRFAHKAQYQGIEYYIITQREMYKQDAWPVVKTILLSGMDIKDYGTVKGVKW